MTEVDDDPLRHLLETISRQVEDIEEQVKALYDDTFVETASDWLSTYRRPMLAVLGIAALVAVWRTTGRRCRKRHLAEAKETVKSRLDSLSEMGETESLRMQMAMDRLSKLMSTLSNLLEKASETATGITQNIK